MASAFFTLSRAPLRSRTRYSMRSYTSYRMEGGSDEEMRAALALPKIGNARARALAEGKPEKIVDKIVEGRMAKYYEEVCLYEQLFIKDNSTTINDVIKAKIAKLGENMSVARFVRFKVGETAPEAAAE